MTNFISVCLGCVFYTTMGLEAILDPRWRLFKTFYYILVTYTRKHNFK